jgi:hypothetical protein
MYEENLRLVLPYVKQLLEAFSGKTVITADHGEMLGNPTTRVPIRLGKKRYNHPGKTYVPELRVVPWHTVDTGSRRQISSEPPEADDVVSEEEINNQLEALGYKA